MIERAKVLLVRRARAPWANAWGAPGGFCEVGEHPIETAEREVLEETGLRVAVTGYVGVWVEEYADEPAPPGAEVINVAYYTASPLGDPEGPVDPEEVSEVRWFEWDELPRNVAPPRTLSAVLAAAGMTVPIRDRRPEARTPPS